jgi:Xaa-Pro dipeptidase
MAGVSLHERHQDAARRLLDERGIESGVFARASSIAWLTGYARPGYLDYAPFRGGPAMVLFDHGSFALLVDDQADLATVDDAIQVDTYVGYDSGALGDAPARLVSELQSRWDGRLVRSQPFGVEMDSVPVALWEAISRSVAGPLAPIALDGMLDSPRSVKSPEEIDVLRRHLALVGHGHAKAKEVIGHGGREIDVWREIHGAIESAAGHRVALGYDCVARSRRVVEGSAGETVIADQGSLLLDLGTHLEGYWTDSCRTYHRGKQSASQVQAHAAVRKALEIGASMIRPGERADNIDRAMRGVIADAGFPPHPHHSGHGIGLSPFEMPYVVGSNPDQLKVGMVLTLEPGTYLPGDVAVRLEDVFLVTPDGAETLTYYGFDDPS